MKTTLMFILFTAIATLCFGGAIQIGAGLDLAGNHEITGNTNSPNSDVATGISPYLELLAQKGAYLYGIGVEYQIQRKVDFPNYPGKMGFVPIYGVARYQIPVAGGVKPEVIGQMGYNLLKADDDYTSGADLSGGVYWGIGAGAVSGSYVGQFMFKANYAKLDYQGDTGKIINTQINLSAGIRF